MQCEELSVRPTQRNRDSRKVLDSHWRTPWPNGLWIHTHGLTQAFDLGFFNLNAPLPSGTALEIVDRDGLPAQHELPGIGSREPVIETGDGNPESLCGFLSRQQGRGHPKNHTEEQQFK